MRMNVSLLLLLVINAIKVLLLAPEPRPRLGDHVPLSHVNPFRRVLSHPSLAASGTTKDIWSRRQGGESTLQCQAGPKVGGARLPMGYSQETVVGGAVPAAEGV